MKVNLFFELAGGEIDSLTISGSLEEIQRIAIYEKEKRGAIDAWSEVVEE